MEIGKAGDLVCSLTDKKRIRCRQKNFKTSTKSWISFAEGA